MTIALAIVLGLHAFLAIGMNWFSLGDGVFRALVGSDAIAHGEPWRVLTSFIVHQPTGQGATAHVVTTLLGLYFLGSTLEQRWGSARFTVLLVASGAFAAALQLGLGQLVPALHAPQFFGSLAVVDAIAIAFALSFRAERVRLFFVLPVSGFALALFVLAMNVLYLVAMETRREGLVTPFGGMLAGYLLSDLSPLRRRYVAWRLARLTAREAAPSPRVLH